MSKSQSTKHNNTVPDFDAQDILDNSPVGIYTSTPDGRFLAANPAMASMIGYDSPNDLIAAVTDIARQVYANPADRDEFKRLMDAQGEVKDQEFRMIRRDGTLIWVSLSGRRVRYSEGNTILYQGFISDITERKRAEEALRVSEERFRLSMHATSDGVWDWDIQTDNVYYSPGYARMLGYETTEIPTHVHTWLDLIHPEDREKAFKGNMDCIENRIVSFAVEFRMQSRNGDWRWILGRGHAVSRDDSGRATRMIGTHQDITERKRGEENLLVYKAAVEQSMDGISLSDMDGHIQFVNKAWAVMHGYNPDELVGRHRSACHTPEQMKYEIDPLIERLTIQGSDQGEFGHVCKDGSTIFTQMTAKVLKEEDGKPVGLLSAARDITKEIKWREQSRFHSYFRTLTAEASARFVLIHDGKTFDEAVGYVLESLGKLFDMDRSYLLRFSEDLSTMTNTHEWYAPGIPPQMHRIQNFSTGHFPWWMCRMKELRPVHIPDVGALPVDAAAERKEFQFQGIQSLLCLPIYNDHRKLIGFMGFDAVRSPHDWPMEQIIMLQMLAEIIGSVISRVEATRAVAASEKKFRFLAENASDFIYQMTIPEGVYEYASPSALRLTGFSPEEFYSTPGLIGKVIHPDWRDYLDQQWSSVLGGNTPELFEYQIVDKHGESRWQAQSNAYLKDKSGNITSMVGIVRDVTERKQAEQELCEQRALEKILTSLAIGFINVPLESVDAALDQMLETIGGFTQTDRVYIFQHDAQRLLTVNTHEWCAEGITPEIGNLQAIPFDLIQDLLDTLQEGETVYIPDAFSLPADHVIRAHFEDQGIQSIVAIPLMYGRKNVGFVGFDSVKAKRNFSESELNILQLLAQIVSNILERQTTERALQASEERYRNYIQNTPHGLFIADKKGCFLFVNPAACSLSGYSEDELLSMKISDLLPTDEHSSSIKHFRDVIRKGKAKGEYSMLTKDGGRKWWSVTSVKISDDRFLGFCHEITLRKQAEEQMRLMATTDDLTGLWNRRHFMRALAWEKDRARRYGHVFSVLLMDIDHFKRINDDYGHDVGDQALRHFAATMQKSLRQVDVLGRLGGEEFGIILPQTDLDGAYSIAERLRKGIERNHLYLNNICVSLTVSMGLVSCDTSTCVDKILKMADDALYKAKNKGRNQTVKHVFLADPL